MYLKTIKNKIILDPLYRLYRLNIIQQLYIFNYKYI